MADFLLEIGLEEVPARMIAGAEAELKRRVLDLELLLELPRDLVEEARRRRRSAPHDEMPGERGLRRRERPDVEVVDGDDVGAGGEAGTHLVGIDVRGDRVEREVERVAKE